MCFREIGFTDTEIGSQHIINLSIIGDRSSILSITEDDLLSKLVTFMSHDV